MYEGQIMGNSNMGLAKASADKQTAACGVMHNPTLAENIDQRINQLESQVERLKRVKTTLATGSMLDVPIEDLRFAMNY